MNAKKKISTQDIVLAAMLTALSMLITFSPFKLPVPQPFSVTLGSHVPTMIAMFINPIVTILTVIGSCVGFAISTSNPVIVVRAGCHLIFSLVGWYMIKKRGMNIFFVIVATSLFHAFSEAVSVYFLTPIIFSDKAGMEYGLAVTAFIGTLFHHYVDTAITAPILYALTKARLIKNTGIKWKINKKAKVSA